MMRAFLLAALAVSGVAAQNPGVLTRTGVRTITIDSHTCKSLFSIDGTPLRSLLTVTASDLVLHTTSTEAPKTMSSTVTVTAPVSTSTMFTSTYVFISVPAITSNTKIIKRDGPTTTFATATFSTTECTNGVPAPQTVTVYSGVYKPVPGQATTLPASYPTQVVCQTTKDLRTVSFQTVFSIVETTTVTPVETVSSLAATVTSTFTLSATLTTWRTTVLDHPDGHHHDQESTHLLRPHRDQDVRGQVRPDEPSQRPRRPGPPVQHSGLQCHERSYAPA